MHLDLTDEETLALLNLLIDSIEADRYQMSPRIRLLHPLKRLAKKPGSATMACRQMPWATHRLGKSLLEIQD